MLTILRGRDLWRTVILIVFLVALAYFFQYLPLFILMALIASLIAISLSDGAKALERVGIPRKWGVAINMMSVSLVVLGLGVVLSSPFYDQLRSFLASLPGDAEASRPFFRELLSGPLGRTPLIGVDFFSTLGRWFSENAAIFDLNLPALFPPVGTLVWQLLGAIIIFMIILATGVYIAMTPASLLRAFLRLFNLENRGRAHKVLEDLYEGLHTWPVATLLSMTAVGVMMTTSYWAIGLPSALLLGVIAGLLEFIPYFGALIAAIPAVLTAATVSPEHVLLTLITIIVVQIINRNIIVPAVMTRVVHVHPAIIAISVIPIYWIFGVLGLFLVVPICVVGKVLIQDLWIERPSRLREESEANKELPSADQDGQEPTRASKEAPEETASKA